MLVITAQGDFDFSFKTHLGNSLYSYSTDQNQKDLYTCYMAKVSANGIKKKLPTLCAAIQCTDARSVL